MATYQHRAGRARLATQRAPDLFGPTSTDTLIAAYRRTRDARDGWTRLYQAACAKLGTANGHDAQWKRMSQAETMGALNKARAAMQSNEKIFTAAEKKLIELGYDLGLLVPTKMPGLRAR